MSSTSATLMELSQVSASKQNSLTSGDGSVSLSASGWLSCAVPDEFCPMAEALREKEREVVRVAAELAAAQRRMRHLDGLAKLGELSAVVAHEIRNPLAGISATAEVLLDDIPVGEPSRESVRIILGEIRRLEKTVRNLLDFARDCKPFITNVDLREVVERALAAVDHQAREHDVIIRGSCPNDLGDARADHELVGQALANIALNAIQAMPEGGELSVTLFAENDGLGRWIKVAITDSGCGISDENVKRIFDPFFTTKASGSGLGLAVSRKTIEAQKGFITVDSAPGRGTTFVVGLPSA